MIQAIRRRQAQSTLEYAILIVIVIAALLSIQVYIKRGVQGKLRSSTDDIGDQFGVDDNSSFTRQVNSWSRTRDTFFNGVSVTNDLAPRQSNTYENVTVGSYNQDDVLK
jgi:hypothetical protein